MQPHSETFVRERSTHEAIYFCPPVSFSYAFPLVMVGDSLFSADSNPLFPCRYLSLAGRPFGSLSDAAVSHEAGSCLCNRNQRKSVGHHRFGNRTLRPFRATIKQSFRHTAGLGRQRYVRFGFSGTILPIPFSKSAGLSATRPNPRH